MNSKKNAQLTTLAFSRFAGLTAVALTLGACGQSVGGQDGGEGRVKAQAVWTQVYADEFNGTSLDSSKWIVSNGAANVNGELEYYTPEDVYLQNGSLVLRTQRRSYGGRGYSSGEVRSGNNVTVTRGTAVEWRTKAPRGKGIWPADWLVSTACNGLDGCGSAWPPEIDVMEIRGSQPGVNNMTHWWGSYPNQGYQTDQFTGPDFSQDFHTYRVEWLADRITFFVDGVQRAQHTANITSGTMQLIMNTAVGGNFDGNPDGSTTFPQYHYIDYVRVYKDTSGSGSSFSVPTDRYVQIVNRSSGKCLDVSGGTSATGDNTPLQQWTCSNNTWQTNEYFKFVPTDSGYYLLQAQHSGKIMAVTGANTADGAAVAQWTYAGSYDSQWKPVNLGGGYFKLIARHSGKALDIVDCSANDGARTKQWTDANNVCQSFFLR